MQNGEIIVTSRDVDSRSAHWRGDDWEIGDHRLEVPKETYGYVVGMYKSFLVVALDIVPPWIPEIGIWAPSKRDRAEGYPFMIPADALQKT